MPISASVSVSAVQVENFVFPPTVKATGSNKAFFLGGAGVRQLDVVGTILKFTAIGVYLEESAISSLAVKWKGKTADELNDSTEFFREVVTGDWIFFAGLADFAWV